MLKVFIVLTFCFLVELQIIKVHKIVDIGHVLTKGLFEKFCLLSQTSIGLVNIFYAMVALSILPVLYVCKNEHITNVFLIGMVARCLTGTLTQLPYAQENRGFSKGEWGGFGKNQSMIWFFSGHCFSISCSILAFQQMNFLYGYYLFIMIQISIILWYLSIRAHYSIDLLVGSLLPFMLNKLI